MNGNKLKIAIDTSYMDRRPGMGTAIVIRHTVEELRRYRDVFDITLIHRETIPEDPLYKEFREIVIPKIPLPKFSGFFSELFFFLTTKEKFDVYYFSYSRLYPFFWLAPAKHIIFAAMDGGPQTAGYAQKTKGKAPWYIRIFLRHVNAFVALSEFGKKGIIETYRVNVSSVHVVYNGVDPTLSPLSEQERTDTSIVGRYGLPHGYILDVSRFDPHKNILNVLRAYAQLVASRDTEYDLVFIGGRHVPSYSALVDEEIRRLGIQGRVHIAPYIASEDMRQIYGHAALMVFPSLYEGFGLPVIEAQASGVPVVISNIEALIEVSGGAAEIVDPHDVDSIANGMRLLLSDDHKRDAIIQRGIENAKRFTWKQHGDTMAQLFEHVMK